MSAERGGLLEDFAPALVEPWYTALADPQRAQEDVLKELLQGYANTDYGSEHNAKSVGSLSDFQRSFPIVSYKELEPYLDAVRGGRHSALLPEPVVCWVMTRGTTGSRKMIPATETHLAQILTLGARGIINFAVRKKDYGVLSGRVLNLNFPSVVDVIKTNRGEESYGYSSGTYARLNPALGETRLVPRQEEIDALGGGIGKRDWDARFELAYLRAKGEEVRSVMGVAPVITAFARYVHRKHGTYPKEFWKMKALFCTSVAKIQTNYQPELRKMYGDAPLVELYTATEGVFAQQLDEQPYLCPNYDGYVFEVQTGKGVKPLHQLAAGEWGKLVVSGPLFPRYAIGDLVESAGKGYFRVFGRDRWLTVAEHWFFNILTGRALRV